MVFVPLEGDDSEGVEDMPLFKSHRKIHVVIDRDPCIGCGMCEGLAPEVFRVNPETLKCEIIGEVTPENKADVMDAVQSCTMQVLSIKH
jgi:ferredoxin